MMNEQVYEIKYKTHFLQLQEAQSRLKGLTHLQSNAGDHTDNCNRKLSINIRGWNHHTSKEKN